MEHVKPASNIVNVFGGQESQMEKQEILESWGRLREELIQIGKRNESCLLVGDLNVVIGSDHLGVKGNHAKISYGGHFVRELLENGDYILANNLEGTTGGPWTWFCRGDGQSKSCLDLVIFSADLLPYFESMKIDKAHEFSA